MPKLGERSTVVWPDGRHTVAVWSKAAHVPLYGWADPDQDDPEDWDLLRPQPVAVYDSKEAPTDGR